MSGWRSRRKLWRTLAAGDFEDGLKGAARDAETTPEALLDELAKQAAAGARWTDPPGARMRRWLRGHVPDALVAAVLVALVLAGWTFAARTPSPAEAVVTRHPLPAGWVLTEGDLELAELLEGRGLETTGAALGRVTLRRLVEGEVVRGRDLGPAPPEGREIVSLALAEGALELRPGERVSLHVSGRGAAGVVQEALVLATGEGIATFAVPPQDLAGVAPLLAEGIVVPGRPHGGGS